jgi:hypothetical protein
VTDGYLSTAEKSHAIITTNLTSGDEMPQISRFFGIVIYMYFNDHHPAHFHAAYGEHEAVYIIDSLEVLRGTLPRRAHGMVVEWATIFRDDLRNNWILAREMEPLKSIDPLE